MADSAWAPDSAIAAADSEPARHSAVVRLMHWIAAIAMIALLVTGAELVVSHPRFYWGETGNVLTTPLFKLPIPASRSMVKTGYNFVLPDQNGWSRYLHFQSAWALVLAGLIYVVYAFAASHFTRNLLPSMGDLSPRALAAVISRHLRFVRPDAAEAHSYNPLQKLSYSIVIFVLTPLVIWTGLAMSPAFVSAVPSAVTLLGGQQSARTIHFFVSVAILLFLLIHIVMVWRAGFRNRMGAMITGRAAHEEKP
jgi:thiosulfate reductase cytochrome b subunit